MDNFLITVGAALNALATANSPDELLDLANKAETLRAYARRAKLGMEAQNRCAEIRLRAERKLGVLLTTIARLRGRPKSVHATDTFIALPRLADLGIQDRRISHRAQRLAEIRERDFETYLKAAARAGVEITTRGVLTLRERQHASSCRGTRQPPALPARPRTRGGRIDDLIAFARRGVKMGCIVIDPPWPTPGQAEPDGAAALDQLRSLPIADLAAERCHVHLWSPPTHHRLACEILDGWGFRPVSEFVWVMPSLGPGDCWRSAHEILVTAVRSEGDRFDDRWLRSWREGSRTEKSDVVRDLLERASPAPRLEIFAKQRTRGWYAWGQEISDPLGEEGEPDRSGARRSGRRRLKTMEGLFVGDCLDVLSEQADASINLIITSPPYAEARSGGIAADRYVAWWMTRAEQLQRVLTRDGSLIVNIKEGSERGEQSTYVLELILAMRRAGWLWVEEYVWHKRNAYPGKWPNRFRNAWERCLHFALDRDFAMYQDAVMVPTGDWAKSRLASLSEIDRIRDPSSSGSPFAKNVSNWLDRERAYPTNVLHLATECGYVGHSAAFPEELPEFFVKLFTHKGNLVCDPFVGSGTTGVVARRLGRHFIGIDILAENIRLAEAPIAELTARVAAD